MRDGSGRRWVADDGAISERVPSLAILLVIHSQLHVKAGGIKRVASTALLAQRQYITKDNREISPAVSPSPPAPLPKRGEGNNEPPGVPTFCLSLPEKGPG